MKKEENARRRRMAGSVNRVRLLLIFHRCWRNGIDNAFPSLNTCLVFSKFEIRMFVSSNPRKIR